MIAEETSMQGPSLAELAAARRIARRQRRDMKRLALTVMHFTVSRIDTTLTEAMAARLNSQHRHTNTLFVQESATSIGVS